MFVRVFSIVYISVKLNNIIIYNMHYLLFLLAFYSNCLKPSIILNQRISVGVFPDGNSKHKRDRRGLHFYAITDNDRQTPYSYLTFNEFIGNNEIKVLKNVSLKPNELSSLKYRDKSLFSTDDKTGLLYKITDFKIEVYDKVNNFSKSETAFFINNHFIYLQLHKIQKISKP
jgi:hypothetical protein